MIINGKKLNKLTLLD